MAKLQRIARVEARRGFVTAPSRTRQPANDNVPPVRHMVGKLLVALASFGLTFGFAFWWLS